MLILKGRGGKSYVMEKLLADRKSIGVFYADNYPYIDNTIICKRSEMSVYDFTHNWLYLKMEYLSQNDYHFDFLVIYTDLEENDPDFNSLIDDIKGKIFPCTEVVLMCK